MSKSYQLTACFLSLLALVACGGSDSSGPGNGANVVITSASSTSAAVENVGGSGEYFVEAWGPSSLNAPGGGTGSTIRLWTSPVTQAPVGHRATHSMGSGGATKWLAKTRASSGYFQSSCWGAC